VKIVILVSYFQPKLGYQEYYLAKEMQKLGHKVDVVTSNYYFPFPDYKNTVLKVLGERKRRVGVYREKGVKVHRLRTNWQLKNGSLIILSGVGKKLEKLAPDVVYCDGVFSYLTIQAAYYKDNLKYKLIYDNHGSPFNTKLRDSLVKKIYMFTFKNFFIPYIKKRADGYVGIGDSERALFCKEYGLGKSEVKIIRLGADDSIFYVDKKKRVEMREKLGVREEEVLLIFAGKITRDKDINVLFESFRLSLAKFRKLKLLLVGGGDESAVLNLKKYAKDNNIDSRIIWCDSVESEKLAYYYNAADIGCWPGNPSVTIFEGLGCGLPMLLPKRIHISHVSDHFLLNNNGYSIERGDYKHLAGLIVRLAEDRELRAKMSRRSEKLLIDNYSWEKIAKQFLNLYEEL